MPPKIFPVCAAALLRVRLTVPPDGRRPAASARAERAAGRRHLILTRRNRSGLVCGGPALLTT